jgi:hypothetical protein
MEPQHPPYAVIPSFIPSFNNYLFIPGFMHIASNGGFVPCFIPPTPTVAYPVSYPNFEMSTLKGILAADIFMVYITEFIVGV